MIGVHGDRRGISGDGIIVLGFFWSKLIGKNYLQTNLSYLII
jgi:hypothetical protein